MKLVEQAQTHDAGVIKVLPAALDQKIKVDDGFVMIRRRFDVGGNDSLGTVEFLRIDFLSVAVPHGIAEKQIILPVTQVRYVDPDDNRIVICNIFFNYSFLL